MWVANRVHSVIGSIIGLALFCGAACAVAQQESLAPSGSSAQSASNPAQTGTGESVPAKPSQARASSQNEDRYHVGSNSPASRDSGKAPTSSGHDEAPEAPEIPGFETRVLKEGEKLPERENNAYEDWSKPELTPGMKWDIVPLGTNEGDGFTRQLLTAQWREMDPIDLWLIKPKGVKNPPVILYLYSSNGSNDRYKNDDFCKFLVKDGFAAVGFVSALTEQRFHDRPRQQTFVSRLEESIGSTVHDVQMILGYLETRGDLDMKRVGMWGDGSGASIAILAAAVDPRINTLDLLDPWGDWTDWLAQSSLVPKDSRATFLMPEFLASVQYLEPMKALAKLNKQNVRLQYITAGVEVTPALAREKMEAAAPPNVKIVHYDTLKQFSEAAAKGVGFEWIKSEVERSHRADDEPTTRKASLATVSSPR